jgi:hypothetical protein
VAALTDQARKALARTLRVASLALMVWFGIILFRSEQGMTGNPGWLIPIAAVFLNMAALTVNPPVSATRVATDK